MNEGRMKMIASSIIEPITMRLQKSNTSNQSFVGNLHIAPPTRQSTGLRETAAQPVTFTLGSRVMNIEVTITSVLLFGAISYSLLVLRLIYRSPCFTKKQKWIQTVITIAVPIFGAWFVHAMYRSDRELPLKNDKDHIPQDANG